MSLGSRVRAYHDGPAVLRPQQASNGSEPIQAFKPIPPLSTLVSTGYGSDCRISDVLCSISKSAAKRSLSTTSALGRSLIATFAAASCSDKF